MSELETRSPLLTRPVVPPRPLNALENPFCEAFLGAEAKSWCFSHPAREPSAHSRFKPWQIIILRVNCLFPPRKL